MLLCHSSGPRPACSLMPPSYWHSCRLWFATKHGITIGPWSTVMGYDTNWHCNAQIVRTVLFSQPSFDMSALSFPTISHFFLVYPRGLYPILPSRDGLGRAYIILSVALGRSFIIPSFSCGGGI